MIGGQARGPVVGRKWDVVVCTDLIEPRTFCQTSRRVALFPHAPLKGTIDRSLRSCQASFQAAQNGRGKIFRLTHASLIPNITQSKQYLTLHTVEDAHPKASDIFAVAPTSTQLLSASGSSSINVYDTTQADFPLVQTLDRAHSLGIHHLVTAREAKRAASAGFEGRVKIWSQDEEGAWSEDGEIVGGYALHFHQPHLVCSPVLW